MMSDVGRSTIKRSVENDEVFEPELGPVDDSVVDFSRLGDWMSGNI